MEERDVIIVGAGLPGYQQRSLPSSMVGARWFWRLIGQVDRAPSLTR